MVGLLACTLAPAFLRARARATLRLRAQVILSLTLSFAVVPLVHFTSSRAKMGSFVISLPTRVVAVVLVVLIAVLNAYLIVSGIKNNSFMAASS